MSGAGWAMGMAVFYIAVIITLCVLSFRKGHWILGLIGFVFPVCWLIGAILPNRRYR